MSGKRWSFLIMRHNNISDFVANLLKKVCNNVEMEPFLQPMANAHLKGGSKNTDLARLGVRARGF